jgi:drug/metabolite transporter (DMT)-like permease
MDFRAIAAGVAFAAIWSSAYTSARIVVIDASPLAALSLRFLISGLLAILIARALGQRLTLERRHLGAVVLFGICQNAIYLGLNFVAMQWVEASVAVIVASLLPLAVALASRIAFGERLAPLGILGLVLGVGGVLLIMQGRIAGGADPWGVALLIVALAALTVATLLVRGALPRDSLLMVVGLQMLVGAAAFAPGTLFLEQSRVDWTLPLVLAFAYTVLFPGIVATLIWFWLVGRVGPTRAAAFHFLNPFLGVGVAALVLGERVAALDILGVAIVAAGILAVQVSRMPKVGPA